MKIIIRKEKKKVKLKTLKHNIDNSNEDSIDEGVNNIIAGLQDRD